MGHSQQIVGAGICRYYPGWSALKPFLIIRAINGLHLVRKLRETLCAVRTFLDVRHLSKQHASVFTIFFALDSINEAGHAFHLRAGGW